MVHGKSSEAEVGPAQERKTFFKREIASRASTIPKVLSFLVKTIVFVHTLVGIVLVMLTKSLFVELLFCEHTLV